MSCQNQGKAHIQRGLKRTSALDSGWDGNEQVALACTAPPVFTGAGFRSERDPSPSEKGNRRPPRGPGHVQHSLQSAAMSLPIRQGGGSDPSPGLGYCIQQMTRLRRDLQGMLNTLKIGGVGRWRQGKLVLRWAKKTSPFAGLVGILQRRALVRRPARPLLNFSYPVRRGAEFQSGCHPHR